MSAVSELDIRAIEALLPLETDQSFDARDTIRYALGVGAGITAVQDESDLRFVYEAELEALPTMAVVLAYPGFWMRRPEFGIDWRRVLHLDQLVTLHAPLPTGGRVRGIMTLESVEDRGAGRGSIVRVRREISDAVSGRPLATVMQGSLLRGNGGGLPRTAGHRWPTPPERAPDATLELSTRPEQALLYRLLGDDNPLHADPAVARSAGFERPILHGLCTFGIAGRAVVNLLCDNHPDRLRMIGGRFTSPVYPGETILTEVWQTGPDTGIFRASVVERGITVLDGGMLEVA